MKRLCSFAANGVSYESYERGKKKNFIVLNFKNNMKREYNVVIEKSESGGYVGQIPGIPGCHSQGETVEELMEHMREVFELCREVGVVDDSNLAEIKKLRVPA